jgi:hypothetical protein
VDFYRIYSIALAVAVAVGGFIGVVVVARREQAFLSTTYPKWIVIAVVLSLVGPILVHWGSPSNVSLADAFFLRNVGAGWGTVLIAYSMLAAVLLGGLIAALTRPR